MPDRYDVSGNVEAQYVDAKQTVLKNKKGFADLRTLQVEEEVALAAAYERLFGEVQSGTPITSELIRYVHGLIFRNLYEWAGRWRTVRISKPGAAWPPPDYLEGAMQDFERDVLKRYSASRLTKDSAFCEAIGQIQGEFLAIHPFREGNARTIKLVTNVLSIQTDRPPLQYDMSPGGRNRYIEAAKAALNGNYALMGRFIEDALEATR